LDEKFINEVENYQKVENNDILSPNKKNDALN
jgi:hypothetical protein